jgi:hypothetical protein
MKSLGEIAMFQCVGFLGQWLGYCRDWPYLIAFWWLLIAVIYLSDSPRWWKIVQTGIQSSALVILLLLSFKIIQF